MNDKITVKQIMVLDLEQQVLQIYPTRHMEVVEFDFDKNNDVITLDTFVVATPITTTDGAKARLLAAIGQQVADMHDWTISRPTTSGWFPGETPEIIIRKAVTLLYG